MRADPMYSDDANESRHFTKVVPKNDKMLRLHLECNAAWDSPLWSSLMDMSMLDLRARGDLADSATLPFEAQGGRHFDVVRVDMNLHMDRRSVTSPRYSGSQTETNLSAISKMMSTWLTPAKGWLTHRKSEGHGSHDAIRAAAGELAESVRSKLPDETPNLMLVTATGNGSQAKELIEGVDDLNWVMITNRFRNDALRMGHPHGPECMRHAWLFHVSNDAERSGVSYMAPKHSRLLWGRRGGETHYGYVTKRYVAVERHAFRAGDPELGMALPWVRP